MSKEIGPVIYKITDPGGNRYVGQAVDAMKRWEWHRYDAGRGKGCPGLGNSIRKYGWEAMQVELLEGCSVSELNAREVALIAAHQTHSNPKGLNCTPGGEQSPMLQPAVVAKVRETWKAKLRDRMAGASEADVEWELQRLDRRNANKRKREAGMKQSGTGPEANAQRTLTWNRKRAKHAAEWEAERLAAEDERLHGMDAAAASRVREQSKKQKERREARREGKPREDGRFKPSAGRHATNRAKMEERIRGLPPDEQARQRRKYAQRRAARARARGHALVA
jgi:hypothetical protein